jgi:hypothetical protein
LADAITVAARALAQGDSTTTTFDYDAYVAAYRPRGIDEAVWREIRPVVAQIATRAGGRKPKTAKDNLWALVGFFVWAVETGIGSDPETALVPHHVERYVATRVSPASKRTVRTRLRRIGHEVTRKAPWPPDPISYSRSHAAVPYTRGEVSALWRSAHEQPTPMRRQLAIAALTVGLGCGIGPRRGLTSVTGRDVYRTDGCVVVQAYDPSRPVTCLARYEDQLLDLARRAKGEPLVGRKHRVNSSLYLLRAHDEGVPLSLARLRSTWIVEHLWAGTPLPVLVEAAGLVSTATLTRLLPYVPSHDAATAARILRGADR